MKAYTRAFLTDMLDQGVLSFGEFVLKSGRKAPYFFNFGSIAGGSALARLGRHYARATIELSSIPEIVFGPAYKGISLATTVAIALAEEGIDVDLSFNRKERKPHGEGGVLVGGSLEGRSVLIVDDVISDGTAKLEAAEAIRRAEGHLIGILVGLDRQEPATLGGTFASHDLSERLGVDVMSVAQFSDLVELLEEDDECGDTLSRLLAYRQSLKINGAPL